MYKVHNCKEMVSETQEAPKSIRMDPTTQQATQQEREGQTPQTTNKTVKRRSISLADENAH